jgi:hypothetical protein
MLVAMCYPQAVEVRVDLGNAGKKVSHPEIAPENSRKGSAKTISHAAFQQAWWRAF